MSRYSVFDLTPSSRKVMAAGRHHGQNAPNQLCRGLDDLTEQSLVLSRSSVNTFWVNFGAKWFDPFEIAAFQNNMIRSPIGF